MILNYEWNGILKHKYDVQQSLKEYGFATRFNSRRRRESFYDCLVPDDDNSYYLCKLSVEEVRDIVDEHPELPIKEGDVDKTEIGDLLYLLELYCDISELFDLRKAEKVNDYDIEFDTSIPLDSIDSEENPKRKRVTSLSMTKEKAQDALRIINKYRLYLRYSRYNRLGRKEKREHKIEASQIDHCKRVLRLCGETVETFMDKIKIDSDRLYWFKDGQYIELE